MNRENAVAVLNGLTETGSIAGVCEQQGVSWEFVVKVLRESARFMAIPAVIDAPEPIRDPIQPESEPFVEPITPVDLVRPRREKRNRA